jgi:hypothetical protein
MFGVACEAVSQLLRPHAGAIRAPRATRLGPNPAE